MYPNRRRGDSSSAPQGNPPSLGLPKSSTPAWAEQSTVNAPGGSGTNVNRNNGENTPATNVQHDIHDIARTTKADHKIYSNQLLTKERGYPLWVPGPGMQLPIEYRRIGISIGDVGIITSTGEFDFLFNILQPPDHAINGGLVPQGFSPISRHQLGRDIHETFVYGPNTYLASSSVRKTSMKWNSETSIDQSFESTTKEAAILVMPDGARTQNLLNTWGVRDTISSNAKDWYTYTRSTCGRYVKNGDIRVVIGVDKVSSWGIATSACNTDQTASYVFKHDPTHTYQWDCIGGSGRVGPQKREIRDLIEDNGVPENQCVFVRTVNFTLSGKMWHDLPSEGVQQRTPGPWQGNSGRQDLTSNNRGTPRGGYGSSRTGSTPVGHLPGSTQGLHRDLTVKFDPVELGVLHPSAALHNALHEKFPDAKMVITEDMDWISVLNNGDVSFPKPEDLCERILKVHELHHHQGIVQIVRKDDPWRPSSSTNLGKDEDVLGGAISSAIGKVRTSLEKRSQRSRPAPTKETRQRIGRGLHSIDAPLHPPVKFGINSVFRNRKNSSSFKSSPFTPTSNEANDVSPISSHSAQDDGGQSVCLEPLGLGSRLPGSKLHIVPECGHAFHEPFTDLHDPSTSRALPQKSNLGDCGVCGRPLKVADGDGGKSNKLASLTAMGDSPFPRGDTSVARTRTAVEARNPSDDDPLECKSNKSAQSQHGQYIVAPSIHVHTEFPSLTRTDDANQHLTCIVVIELPGRRRVPDNVILENYGKPRSQHSTSSQASIPRHRKNRGLDGSFQNQQQPSDTEYASIPDGPQTHDYSPNSLIYSEEDSPLQAITEDLRNRITDWKGLPLSDLGPLQMYDLLSVRRESALREFYVYVFQEAIICVVEEKKHGPSLSSHAASSLLRLKGIIYVRHIKNVIASSAAGDMSLTIDVEDELASFILIFKDRASLQSWKSSIQALVSLYHAQNAIMRHQDSERPPDLETFGGSQKASSRSPGSLRPRQNKPASVGEDDDLSNYDDLQTNLTPHTSSGPSNSLSPLPHPQMDLLLVISIPPLKSLPRTAQLKIGIIKSMLDFLVASLGPKDRLSVVTFEVGMGCNVRKTPFLMVGRSHSRMKLQQFIDETGVKVDGNEDEFLVRASKEEKTDVITAVNHGLDVVLQRKERNPVSGMILISDASDSIRRAQMDLVLAHAETADVPIHSFGYGPSHDPASLWLMSNHTSGTYTFVKDWYDLRDCVAGCVGGMMSIGLLNLKLRLNVVDSHRFKIRNVSGGPRYVLSDRGQKVDVDVGELRYGEKKEILIELELDNSDHKRLAHQRAGRDLNATGQLVPSLGMDALTDEGRDLDDGILGGMLDEVPVLEVHGSFFDLDSGRNISRLPRPVLLTTTILPGSQNFQKPPAVSDPVIIRRRMELLASDMITRALVLVSRRNLPQAQKILAETKRILHTVLQTISRSLTLHTSSSGSRNRKELAAIKAIRAILQDLRLLSDALEDDVELFVHDQRNFGTQQAMILKDQKSWSGRSATERVYWTTDNSIELVSRSTDWVAPAGDITALARPESPTLGLTCQNSGSEISEDPPFSDLPPIASKTRHIPTPHNWSLSRDIATCDQMSDPYTDSPTSPTSTHGQQDEDEAQDGRFHDMMEGEDPRRVKRTSQSQNELKTALEKVKALSAQKEYVRGEWQKAMTELAMIKEESRGGGTYVSMLDEYSGGSD